MKRLFIFLLLVLLPTAFAQIFGLAAFCQNLALLENQAANRDSNAQLLLCKAYKDGRRVPQDYAEAYFWCDLAAAGTLENTRREDATRLRIQLASHLTKEVISQQQARALTWFEVHEGSGTTGKDSSEPTVSKNTADPIQSFASQYWARKLTTPSKTAEDEKSSPKEQGTEADAARANVLLKKALNAIGPSDELKSCRTLKWTGTIAISSGGAARFSQVQSVTAFPDQSYISLKSAQGPMSERVLTRDFSYTRDGSIVSAIPANRLATYRSELMFQPPYIAQHADEFALASQGEKRIGDSEVDLLRISIPGAYTLWAIDARTGRLVSSTYQGQSGDPIISEYSDYRLISGMYVPFKRHTQAGSISNDVTIDEYEVNPSVNEALFQRPANIAAPPLRLRVLQANSVPYTVESGGGISTGCNISGSANTTAYVKTFGNTGFGNATTNSNMRMNCNSYDTTVRWQHILNAMFVEASDGNAYIIACDRAWRWSKCVPLRAGQTFNARFTNKGIEVQGFSAKGKEEQITYRVLQSKSLH